jgi:hypothetical protein
MLLWLVQRRLAILRVLIVLDALFVVGYISTQLWQGSLTRALDLDAEHNWPSLYSALQLGLVSLVCSGVVFFQRGQQGSFQKLPAIGGMVFAGLALDEYFSLHEQITMRFKSVTWLPRFNGNHGLWIPIYLACVVVLFAVLWRDIWAIMMSHKRAVALATLGGAVYLAGAVGLEIISYEYIRFSDLAYLYKAEVVLEEGCEMLGISILVFASLCYGADLGKRKPH